MNRSAALIYIKNLYPTVAEAVDLAENDDAANYGPAIDDALLLLEVAYEQISGYTVPSAQVLDYRSLLRYTTLRLLEGKLLDATSDAIKGDGGFSEDLSVMLKQVRSALQAAQADVRRRGYNTVSLQYGTIQLDIAEPDLDE